MPEPNSFTIGWICALTEEYVAAKVCLDETYPRRDFSIPNDGNQYTFGRVHEHFVVIAVLPNGQYGQSSAAAVATNMTRTFPDIRLCLMVGIGGGAPSRKNNIRLGDIVVGVPRNGHSGVIHYDFGKTVQDQKFRRTGVTNQAPPSARTAISELQTRHIIDGYEYGQTLEGIITKNPRLRNDYGRPDISTDRLYKSDIVHPADDSDDETCETTCGSDAVRLVKRPTVEGLEPAIHYGLIASGSQLIKDATFRDKLIREENILCFEMEAAGLVNQFPCLVIRGICDYSDSHKNDRWQGFAAMSGAIYARDFLSVLTPTEVRSESKVRDVFEELCQILGHHTTINQQILQVQQRQALEQQMKNERHCHQLFRLVDEEKGASYEWYKDRIDKRVEHTCLWFLNHEKFKTWIGHERGPLLVSADPGCGKSVLARYLIDDYLPRTTSAAICYFFFKDGDQTTQRQMLCAVLHQLFTVMPQLIRHAVNKWEKDHDKMIHSSVALWGILRAVVTDASSHPVIIVLDALDECDEHEFRNLITQIENQFQSTDREKPNTLRYLLTSRPYARVTESFGSFLHRFPDIRIPGEENLDDISKEVSYVIAYRINRLAEKKNLSPELKKHMELKLNEPVNRTYLWIYMVFEYLENKVFKKTLPGVNEAIQAINKTPGNINEAYNQILERSSNRTTVHRVLSFILAAYRPLSIWELQVMLLMPPIGVSFVNLNFESSKDFTLRIRDLCGLFISIHHGRVYFLHQTAREFLLRSSEDPSMWSNLRWRGSIVLEHAHRILAGICIQHLKLCSSPINCSTDEETDHQQVLAVLEYTATHWCRHFEDASEVIDDVTVQEGLSMYSPGSEMRELCVKRTHNFMTKKILSANFGALHTAAGLGHTRAVDRLLRQETSDGETIRAPGGRTPLMLAASYGHLSVCKILLNSSADVDDRDTLGRTALPRAEVGYEDYPHALPNDSGSAVNVADDNGCTALLCGVSHHEIVKFLVSANADVNIANHQGLTPLMATLHLTYMEYGEGFQTAEFLIENGAMVNVSDAHGDTPLLKSLSNPSTVKLLVSANAEVNTRNHKGLTPLMAALDKMTYIDHEDEPQFLESAKILIENGADVNIPDALGNTPLMKSLFYPSVVELLISANAAVNTANHQGLTPLMAALDNMTDIFHEYLEYHNSAKTLIENGADVNISDALGNTPLMKSLFYPRMVELLISANAAVNTANHQGLTPLMAALDNMTDLFYEYPDYHESAKILIETGANVNISDALGNTPLMKSLFYPSIVRLLISANAAVNTANRQGLTPLMKALDNGSFESAKILIDHGADFRNIDAEKLHMIYPAKHWRWLERTDQEGLHDVIQMLLSEEVTMEEEEYDDSPLRFAARQSYESAVEFLLE